MIDTSGFYAYFDETLQYSDNAVYFPDGSVIVESEHSNYNYPIAGWYYFDSRLQAEEFFGIAVLLNA